MNSAYLLLRALLIVLWPPAVVAATGITLDVTVGEIPLGVWSIIMILSTMGGLTSLLHRLKLEVPSAIVLYVASHMLMAWFAGAAAFFVLEVAHTPDLLEIPLIGIAAYSGARLVDTATERFAVWFGQKLNNVLGIQKNED